MGTAGGGVGVGTNSRQSSTTRVVWGAQRNPQPTTTKGRNKMKIELNERELYGRIVFYPANPNAVLMAKLTKTKTFGKAQLEIFRSLGFEILIGTQSTARSMYLGSA